MYLINALEGFILSRTADGVSPHTVNIYKWGLYRFAEYLKNPDIENISRGRIFAVIFITFKQLHSYPQNQ